MKIEILQHSHNSINSVYIFRDFLDDLDYLKKITEKVALYTEKDEMNHQTNVKANMTGYKKLIEDDDFNFVHKKIMETIAIVFKLRVPSGNQKIKLTMIDSWGMRHKQGENTATHVHTVSWATAFYLYVPHETNMFFEEYYSWIPLTTNSLVFFQGFTKHAVNEHIGDQDRLSMASNITHENVPLEYKKNL